MYYRLQKDETLIDLLGQSDARAFEEIYRRYWVVVFKYAVGQVHIKEIAEDLCQDVFVSLWQRRSSVSILNLEAYLVQATKYSLLNHIRLKISSRKYYDQAPCDGLTDNETENNLNMRILLSTKCSYGNIRKKEKLLTAFFLFGSPTL